MIPFPAPSQVSSKASRELAQVNIKKKESKEEEERARILRRYGKGGLFKLKKLIVFPYQPGILAWVDCFE